METIWLCVFFLAGVSSVNASCLSCASSRPPCPSNNCTYTCPSNWILEKDYCYFFGSDTKTQTWTQAEKTCQDMGGHLPSIHDNVQNEFLAVKAYKTSGYPHFWSGLSVNNQTKFLEWSDGCATDFSNWAKKQPLAPEGGMCIVITINVQFAPFKLWGFEWSVAHCEAELPTTICMKAPNIVL
ncbi:hypothetical protein L596_010509 [Steinernema carpocapsae]|uniref:C-type lectin domain-containing protein n=1 Tax=Steinernema carpocapsae TaxID=34508 RepID=A0A4U5PJ98_STECR|nr:hypothetical protein L596_010509 [Steinernema carpocapsae]